MVWPERRFQPPQLGRKTGSKATLDAQSQPRSQVMNLVKTQQMLHEVEMGPFCISAESWGNNWCCVKSLNLVYFTSEYRHTRVLPPSLLNFPHFAWEFGCSLDYFHFSIMMPYQATFLNKNGEYQLCNSRYSEFKLWMVLLVLGSIFSTFSFLGLQIAHLSSLWAISVMSTWLDLWII